MPAMIIRRMKVVSRSLTSWIEQDATLPNSSMVQFHRKEAPLMMHRKEPTRARIVAMVEDPSSSISAIFFLGSSPQIKSFIEAIPFLHTSFKIP